MFKKGPLVKWRVSSVCFWLLICSVDLHAHLLNMTEVQVDIREPEAAKLIIKIDLGQSLMRPADYWQAVSAQPAEQAQLLAPFAEQLSRGIKVSIDGQVYPSLLLSWQLEALSLEAIKNPLSPQMATLAFAFDTKSVPAIEVVEVSIDENLKVPWPTLLRVDSAENPLPVSRLLTANERSSRPIALNPNSSKSDTSTSAGLIIAFLDWIPSISWAAIGFQHIIPSGLDHIVFVLGLFFLSTKLSTLLYQVSCFTVAHSLTLGLATLGMVSIPASVVEPLIAASIIFIAVDNLYSHSLARWRLAIVTIFGLLHGLGFAAALSDLILPADNFFSALFFFNLGVEVGQLTVLVLAFLTIGWLRNWTKYSERVARPATVTIAGIGTYWLVKRIALV